MPTTLRYLTAQEAAQQLGISLPTLYSYVSRGLIRSEETGGSKRERRYLGEDVNRLKQRKEQRQNPIKVAEQALHFGEPVLDSAITLISDSRLYYRGYEATELALSHSVEEVAHLIWLGELKADGIWREARHPLPVHCQALLPQLSYLPPMEVCQILLPLAATEDLASYSLTPHDVAQTGARIMHQLALMFTHTDESLYDIVTILQQGWTPQNPPAIPLLRAALIVCADHELNVSSFTARCVASAGGTPYSAVTAGLSALQGAKHGGYTERVAAFLQEIDYARDVRAAIVSRLKRGDEVPGFGHVLYPDGDPRGRTILNLTFAAYPQSQVVLRAQAIIAEVLALTGRHPTIDFGLTILSQTLGLPLGAALALFALGRTMGWIGHAIEQYQLDRMIRPRARYIGVQPQGKWG